MTDESPLDALLRGDSTPPGAMQRLGTCNQALMDFITAINNARASAGQRRLTAFAHVQNLAQAIAEMLSEATHVVGVEGEIEHGNVMPFGLLISSYDLDFLRRSLVGVTGELSPEPNQGVDAALEVMTAYLQLWVDYVIPAALGEVDAAERASGVVVKTGPRLSSTRTAETQLRRIANLERQAMQQVQNIKTAAGEGGNERLAQTFETRGRDEAEAASRWNWLVMAFVALGIILPFAATAEAERILGELTANELILKALIGLPLFALATYCGRISAQHRNMALHMKTLTAQFDTVRAYVAPLPDSTRDDIIAGLGRRAFSEPGITTSDGAVGVPPEQLIPALRKAIQAVKDIRK